MDFIQKMNIPLFGFLALPYFGCIMTQLITGTNINEDWYNSLIKPPFSPPHMLCIPVWTVLYFFMGFSSYVVYLEGGERLNGSTGLALALYAVQLIVNWLWAPIFFGYRLIVLAFYTNVVLWIGVFFNIIMFFKVLKICGIVLIPYLIWVSYATYLSYATMVLNTSDVITLMK